MMKNEYFVVYEKDEAAINANLMVSGELVFVISDKNYFTVRGQNIIFGAGEILYGMQHKKTLSRTMKVYSKEGTRIQQIPNQNLKRYIALYNIGFNITKFIAECVRKTNQILAEMNSKLAKSQGASRRYYKFYYKTITQLENDAVSRGNEQIELFVHQKMETLAYRKGKSFSKDQIIDNLAIPEQKLDDITTKFPKGSVLCRQNDAGGDMFVLNHGAINVLLDDEEIHTISAPGTVFGEMSLLLNEPRSATLTAAEDSVVTVVTKERLQAIAERMPDFFLKISTTLWERLRNNVDLIHEFEQLDSNKARHDLELLAKELNSLFKSERVAWLLKYKEEVLHAL